MIVTYTVIVGGYDKLRPTKFPGVCLIDAYPKQIAGWTLMEIERAHEHPRRASRHPKMRPDLYFPNAEYSIYMDGNIDMLISPKTLLKELKMEHDMALFKHPQRNCLYQEARACIKYKKGIPSLIKQQVARYDSQGYPRKAGLAACWVIIRKHTEQTAELGRLWWDEYLKGSARDQLSFDYARWVLNMKYDKIPGNLFKGDCPYFRRGKHDRLA